jgi:DNA polymerase III sliding clamp (beta) subunit (PCNA family)
VTGTANTWAQVRYLRDLLQAMRGTTITIAAGGPNDPIFFSDPDDSGFRALQMPIREGGG